MATEEKSKRQHSPEPEEDDEDEFVGPMPVQQKLKKRKGIFDFLLCFYAGYQDNEFMRDSEAYSSDFFE